MSSYCVQSSEDVGLVAGLDYDTHSEPEYETDSDHFSDIEPIERKQSNQYIPEVIEYPVTVFTRNAIIADEKKNGPLVETEQLVSGTIVRVYWSTAEHKWMVGTRNVADASKAYWHSKKDFRTLFEEAILEDIVCPDKLDELMASFATPCGHSSMRTAEFCHVFSFSHRENPIVGKTNYKVYYLYSLPMSWADAGTTVKFSMIAARTPLGLSADGTPHLDMKDSRNYFKEGVIAPGIIGRFENGKSVMYQTAEWINATKYKGNQKNMKFRCVEVFQEGVCQHGSRAGNAFTESCPDFVMLYDEIESTLECIISAAQDTYFHKYVRKQKGMRYSSIVNFLMKKFHRHYHTTGERISYDEACVVVATLPTSLLYSYLSPILV